MAIEIVAYTDGSSSGNPGPGGFGVVLISGAFRKEISQGYKYTTNNRMELLAAIVALEALKNDGCNVKIFTDSKYVADPINKKWVYGWVKNNFKEKKNPDLWKRFLEVYKKHTVEIIWIKGHAQNKENERCDRLAVAASQCVDQLVDEGYVNDK